MDEPYNIRIYRDKKDIVTSLLKLLTDIILHRQEARQEATQYTYSLQSIDNIVASNNINVVLEALTAVTRIITDPESDMIFKNVIDACLSILRRDGGI